MRGCTDKIADLLGKSYSVTGIIKPNARLSAITSSLKREIESLTQEDLVIICGGTNDVAKNETTLGLRSLDKFVENINNTNVILLGVLHRFDLMSTSCVNSEVNSFNRKLKKILKRYKNVSLIWPKIGITLPHKAST
jgi:lysophospholipase L1-like esterase